MDDEGLTEANTEDEYLHTLFVPFFGSWANPENPLLANTANDLFALVDYRGINTFYVILHVCSIKWSQKPLWTTIKFNRQETIHKLTFTKKVKRMLKWWQNEFCIFFSSMLNLPLQTSMRVWWVCTSDKKNQTYKV